MNFNAAQDCLLVIDVQNDFIPGGSLAAPNGDAILPSLFSFISLIKSKGGMVVTTQDWHPSNHVSFVEFGGSWPSHCVANTHGASFPKGFPLEAVSFKIQKGKIAEAEAYSGFSGTDLHAKLSSKKIKRVFVVGYCTDFCVKETAQDALKNGYETVIIKDLSAPVFPDNEEKVLRELEKEGISVVMSKLVAN